MTSTEQKPEPSPEPLRQRRILDAAVATFVRFGYRKTAMGEVARAAHISRQALYLHFATKEELFCAAFEHALKTSLAAAEAQVCEAQTLQGQLAGAFDAWGGSYVGTAAGSMMDIEMMGERLVKPLLTEYEGRFIELVAKTIRSTELAAAYRAHRISARQLAELLFATARGLKHLCGSQEEFRERFEIALRTLCIPLAASKR